MTQIDQDVYVYMWNTDDWCFPEDLQISLINGKSDDYRKVCLGETDYPEELCD